MTTIPRYKISFPLQTNFVINHDGCRDHIFTQLRRSGNVCLYRRNNIDGKVIGYEVFIVKTIKAGHHLPGGFVVQADYETYPGTSIFGRTAWFTITEDRADKRFTDLLKVNLIIETTEDRDNERFTEPKPIKVPNEAFTFLQFAKLNDLPLTQETAASLQKLCNTKEVKLSKVLQVNGKPVQVFIKA